MAVVTDARSGSIDYGRFVAALGIVWFYIDAPGTRVAYLALPFFLVLLSMPAQSDLATRAKELLRPFLVWSVVFAILNMSLAIKNHAAPFGWWEWHMLVTGTWGHLWFLPFALVTTVLAPWFRHPLASLGAALLTATLLSVVGTPVAMPFGAWAFGVIPVLVGISFFSWGLWFALITLLSSWLILHLGRPAPDNITILLGTALALAALSYRMPTTPLSDWCARLSVWIYLGHPLVIILGSSLRITWVELGLFSLIGSVMLAQVIEAAARASGSSRAGF